MVEAISPNEVAAAKAKCLPEYVLRAFNDLIAERFTGGRAQIKQDEAIARIQFYSGYVLDRQEIFNKGYLNIEEVYREKGWKVDYDKPGYNESYGAFWVFKVK